MSVMVTELYQALMAAGVSEDQARQAAQAAVPNDAEHVATKSDIQELKLALQQMETRLLRTIITTLIAVTAIFGAIVKLF